MPLSGHTSYSHIACCPGLNAQNYPIPPVLDSMLTPFAQLLLVIHSLASTSQLDSYLYFFQITSSSLLPTDFPTFN